MKLLAGSTRLTADSALQCGLADDILNSNEVCAHSSDINNSGDIAMHSVQNLRIHAKSTIIAYFCLSTIDRTKC